MEGSNAMLDVNRRQMLSGLGMTALAASLPATAIAKMPKPFFERIGKPIGLQLYMLGEDIAQDLDATFATLASIGYREVELPNLLGKTPAELAATAARAGLKIVSLHLPVAPRGSAGELSLASPPQQLTDAMGALGARWAIAPICLLPDDFRPRQGESFGESIPRAVAAAGEGLWQRTADGLNRAGAALKPLGVQVGYHNHNIEFAPIAGASRRNARGWDILWRETEADLVSFEIDLGWVATAGLDPVRFLERGRGRFRLLHVKDTARDNPQSFLLNMRPAEVGAGSLDWPRLMRAAQRAGILHYLVEQEPPFAIPRMEAARRSFNYLQGLRA